MISMRQTIRWSLVPIQESFSLSISKNLILATVEKGQIMSIFFLRGSKMNKLGLETYECPSLLYPSFYFS